MQMARVLSEFKSVSLKVMDTTGALPVVSMLSVKVYCTPREGADCKVN